ncbi:MAG: RHS repeat-associated core domain-containing protein [Pseudomonas fluorescens]
MNSVHRHTPAVSVIDSRGLPLRQLSYLRRVIIDTPIAHITFQQHDAAGRPVERRDPRLKVPNLVTIHSLSGAVLCTDSVDAGWRLGLPGEAQQTVENWDGRGSHWRIEYDQQQRPVAIHEETDGQPEQTLERLSYANYAAEFTARNQCGQLIRHDDTAGTLLLDQHALTGEVISQTRRFLPDTQTANWPLDEVARDTLLEPDKRYLTRQRYSPRGELIRQTDAGDHQQRWSFNRAGQLNGIELTLKDKDAQPLLTATDYNAAGQLLSQTAGKRVTTLATFEPDSGRLSHLSAAAPGNTPLQDQSYTYDPVGNISLLMDNLQTVGYFDNQRVTPETTYTYDSLYQLTSASGREAVGASIRPGLPELISPIDPGLLLNYTQKYEYDEGGNLTTLRHQRSGNNYTRTMRIADDSNRAVPWQEGDPDPDFKTCFDRNGNLQTLMPGTQPMTWDGRNQLQELITVYRDNAANDGEYYRYDSQGARVRKVHLVQAKTVAHRREARYLPNVEIRTLDDSKELHVISVPLGYGNVRCLHWVKGKPDLIEPDQLRYSVNDHLGSSTLELDKNAAIISHEGYYPYGGTAWWAARSEVEADYKTIRYSGKEQDASGLVYYGLRYLAPWLARWINPDPLGTVDGLNVYRMVGNNPINFVDEQGGMRSAAAQNLQQTTITIGPSPSSSTSSVAGSTMSLSGLPALVDNPRENPPGMLPPEPAPEGSRLKRAALWFVNSKVGLALSPTATSSPANAAFVATVLTAATQVFVHATIFNPVWSPPGTWDPAGGGEIPPPNVTQAANSTFGMINASITLAGAVAGAVLGPIVGGYVDELRGTKEKAEKKAMAAEMTTTINRLTAEQRLLENVTKKAQDSLHEQVLEVESLTDITWNTMEMLEKIQNLRPGVDSVSGVSSRRDSLSSQNSTNSTLRRGQPSRIPRPNSRSSSTASVQSTYL